MDIKEKIEELRAELHRHNYNYYVLNAPEISDKEFDDKMRELQDLEQAHPEYKAVLFPQDSCCHISEGYIFCGNQNPE